jgi:hypothetical protein
MAWWKTRLKEKAETSQTIITPELVMIFLTVAVLCHLGALPSIMQQTVEGIFLFITQ